jgi:asparagine synthase (glutamine-hydrolysing)
VVLAGDVGDELFGGYSFYKVENEMKNHFSYGNIVAKFGLNLYQKLKPTSFVTQQNLKYKNILDFHQNQVRNFLNMEDRKTLGISNSFQQPYSFTSNPNSLNDIMRVDLEKYVPGNMLVKSDRMAMANSLEVRTPFLDKDFAEFCISLPDSLKINSEQDKIILREVMQNYWTDSIRNRGKQGFGSSVENWFEQKSLIDLSNSLLKDKSQKVFDYIDFNASQKFLNKDKKHWNLLQLALWAENNREPMFNPSRISNP